jgi:hypothetical protein
MSAAPPSQLDVLDDGTATNTKDQARLAGIVRVRAAQWGNHESTTHVVAEALFVLVGRQLMGA